MARLIKQVANLEAAAARQLEAAPSAVGIAWSDRVSEVEFTDLEPGQFVAIDIRITQAKDEESPECWQVTERATWLESDLGVVTDAEGDRVGLVVAIEADGLITWRADRAAG